MPKIIKNGYEYGSAGAGWGSITGTISDQTDLQEELDDKANQSEVATIESSSTASTSYSAGDYLVYGGSLYKVTTAISSGETLTVGTNIEATTVGDELIALNDDLSTLTQFVYNGTSYAYPLQIMKTTVVCANKSTATATFTAFSHGALTAFSFCEQVGFSAYSNTVVNSLSNGSVTVYQTNSASASMTVGVVIFGY